MIGASARTNKGHKQSLEALGVLPEGLEEEVPPSQHSTNTHLYVFELASSGRGRVYYKVGRTCNIRTRAKEIRLVLNRAGRYSGFTVQLLALFCHKGSLEEDEHRELRKIPRASLHSQVLAPTAKRLIVIKSLKVPRNIIFNKM